MLTLWQCLVTSPSNNQRIVHEFITYPTTSLAHLAFENALPKPLWEFWVFLWPEPPASLHGPAINLSLLQTQTFQFVWLHWAHELVLTSGQEKLNPRVNFGFWVIIICSSLVKKKIPLWGVVLRCWWLNNREAKHGWGQEVYVKFLYLCLNFIVKLKLFPQDKFFKKIKKNWVRVLPGDSPPLCGFGWSQLDNEIVWSIQVGFIWCHCWGGWEGWANMDLSVRDPMLIVLKAHGLLTS